MIENCSVKNRMNTKKPHTGPRPVRLKGLKKKRDLVAVKIVVKLELLSVRRRLGDDSRSGGSEEGTAAWHSCFLAQCSQSATCLCILAFVLSE